MDLPENLLISCNQFRLKLNQLKLACSDFLKNYDKLRENAKNNALEEARLDLTLLFTLNSLFWGKFLMIILTFSNTFSYS